MCDSLEQLTIPAIVLPEARNFTAQRWVPTFSRWCCAKWVSDLSSTSACGTSPASESVKSTANYMRVQRFFSRWSIVP